MTSRASASTSRRPATAGPRRPAVAAVTACALLAALAGCAAGPATTAATGTSARTSAASAPPSASPGSATSGSPPSGTATPAATASPRATAAAKPSALPVAPPGAAARPQTTALPRTDDPAFKNAVHDIWLAVTTGDSRYALPAFFPVQAYEQVKAISDPAADWQNRLWAEFTLDLAAAHRLVPAGATLTGVTVPAQYAQWIPVGGCYNKIGYWHVPGARVIYRADGVTRSFGIASFISWRGDWYLVHFGAVLRTGSAGVVDDPETGPGTPGPPGGC